MTTTKDTLDHDSYDATVEHPTTQTVSILDRPVASVDAATSDVGAPVPSSLVGMGCSSSQHSSLPLPWPCRSSPAATRHRHPSVMRRITAGYGQATPVVAAPLGDAKDHAGYGQVTPVVAGSLGDAKDHAGYGQVTSGGCWLGR